MWRRHEKDPPRFAKTRATGALSFLFASATACVLLVPEKTYEPHCDFMGSDTPCGQCLTANCAEKVDACCADMTCGDVIHEVESCSVHADDTCAKLQSVDDKNGAHADVSSCVLQHCAGACRSAHANLTECAPAYPNSKNACTCSLDGEGNSAECTSVGFPTLRCCAPDAWPGPALECDCLAVICTPLASGCLCELTTMDTENRATQCNGSHCCVTVDGTECVCSDAACVPGDTEVASCGIEQLQCSRGLHPVDACSIAQP